MKKLLNAPRAFIIYSTVCIMIFAGFFTLDYVERDIYTADDGSHLLSYNVWDETPFIDAVSINNEIKDK